MHMLFTCGIEGADILWSQLLLSQNVFFLLSLPSHKKYCYNSESQKHRESSVGGGGGECSCSKQKVTLKLGGSWEGKSDQC